VVWVTHGKGGKIKIIKSLLKNEHPCEYAVFLTGFLDSKRARPKNAIPEFTIWAIPALIVTATAVELGVSYKKRPKSTKLLMP
jgi:hypothetical protein